MTTPIHSYCQTHGPMGVDDFFRLCMYHEKYGYYHNKIPMGTQGDYVTSPEISQVFGELIGLWCLDVWQKLGQPNEMALVELGPGRGLLMADLLRVARLVKGFNNALQIHFVEVSPQLRLAQQRTLDGQTTIWHKDLSTLPPIPTIFIANEFFDALPHKQYQEKDQCWHERLIVCQDHHFSWTLSPHATSLPYEIHPQAIVEAPQEGELIINQIASHLHNVQGAALIIDYGADSPHGYGDTLQALYRHQRCSPFDYPGKSDLTFHVNFHSLRQLFKHNKFPRTYLTTQGRFLQEMGIEERTTQLAKIDSRALLATFRLISAQHMGQLFKVLGVSSSDIQLIGFS